MKFVFCNVVLMVCSWVIPGPLEFVWFQTAESAGCLALDK
jgi:hypothetical protein